MRVRVLPSGLMTSAARLFAPRAAASDPEESGDGDAPVLRSANPAPAADDGDEPEMTATLRGFVTLSSFTMPITEDKGP